MCRFLRLNGCRRGPQGDFREWLVRLPVKRDKTYSAWMDMAPPQMHLSDPDVQLAARLELQDQIAAKITERVAALIQAQPGMDPEVARQRAEAAVESEMTPILEAMLAKKNKESLENHKKEFPYSEFTFALITLVLADLPTEKMEKFSLYLKNKGIKITALTFDLI